MAQRSCVSGTHRMVVRTRLPRTMIGTFMDEKGRRRARSRLKATPFTRVNPPGVTKFRAGFLHRHLPRSRGLRPSTSVCNDVDVHDHAYSYDNITSTSRSPIGQLNWPIGLARDRQGSCARVPPPAFLGVRSGNLPLAAFCLAPLCQQGVLSFPESRMHCAVRGRFLGARERRCV